MVILALVFMFGVGYSLSGLVQEGIAAPMGSSTPAAEWSGFSHSYTTGSSAKEDEDSTGQKAKEQTRKQAATCDDVNVLVDRSHALPPDYVPTDLASLQDYRVPTLGSEVLRREAAQHLGRLVESAAKVGEELVVASATAPTRSSSSPTIG